MLVRQVQCGDETRTSQSGKLCKIAWDMRCKARASESLKEGEREEGVKLHPPRAGRRTTRTLGEGRPDQGWCQAAARNSVSGKPFP